MGNCLKTQLKSIVDNENLPFFGWHGIKVEMNSAGVFNNPFEGAPSTSDVMIRGNAYFADSAGTNLGKSAKADFHHIYAEPGTFYLDWKDKSITGTVTQFFCKQSSVTINIDELSYIFDPTLLTKISTFAVSRTNGNIAALREINVTYMLQFEVSRNLVGNITDINPVSNISISNTGITGTVESLLQKFASSVNKTLSIAFRSNPGITYNGEVVDFVKQVRFDGQGNYTILN